MGAPTSRHYDPATTILGPQQAVALDHVAPSTVFVGVWLEDGIAEYEVELTTDDVNDTSVTPRWFTLDLTNEGPIGARWTSILFPMRFVRLNISMFTGALELKVLQTSDALRC
jgi:hypothetical protein